MKKKIIALCLVVCLLATAIAGTVAYFQDSEQATNEFAIGNVKIDLYETVGHKDGADAVKADEETLGKDSDATVEYKYDAIMPGDTMKKVATVENEGTEDAYIALVIKQENYLNFNQKIDDYYEPKIEAKTFDKSMQEVTDSIFPGWNLRYTKPDASKDLRYVIETPPANQDGAEVLGVGYANSTKVLENGQYVDGWNYNGAFFTNQLRYTKDDMDGNFDSLKQEHTRMWIVYLKVAPGKAFTMDLTTVCPSFIDGTSLEAFNGMKLDVKAFAIQADGFAEPKAAFAEAFKADDCFNY